MDPVEQSMDEINRLRHQLVHQLRHVAARRVSGGSGKEVSSERHFFSMSVEFTTVKRLASDQAEIKLLLIVAIRYYNSDAHSFGGPL
ncbi:MAG: hypothetical protein ACR2NP_14080 [Pirellulaceae bacterium]